MLVCATLVVLAFFWPDRWGWYWALPMVVFELLLFWWLTPAWPNCPNCGEYFGRLGWYCPDCGKAFPQDATPKQAYCPHCRYLVEIISQRPKAKRYRGLAPVRNGISRYPHPKEGPLILGEYRYVLVPLRYCTHCRARLGS